MTRAGAVIFSLSKVTRRGTDPAITDMGNETHVAETQSPSKCITK